MNEQPSLGTIEHKAIDRRTDYLYRLSLKGLIRNEAGEVLVVKESGRDWWDLPGGGMDHNENIKQAIARELKEEVNLDGDFKYRIIATDEPAYLQTYNFWQVRLIFKIVPESMTFSVGEDGDEIAFMHPDTFVNSSSAAERHIYRYAQYA